jgi:cell division FtsZ-interacting protein ZapD
MTEKENPRSEYYQIVVKGHLKTDLYPWLDEMHIQNLPNGEAMLSGPLVDQAMLHGLLIKIRDMGLPLISVNNIGPMNRERKGS